MYVTLRSTVASTRTVASVFIPSIIKIDSSGDTWVEIKFDDHSMDNMNSEVLVSQNVSDVV